jgi:hypothetical protein
MKRGQHHVTLGGLLHSFAPMPIAKTVGASDLGQGQEKLGGPTHRCLNNLPLTLLPGSWFLVSSPKLNDAAPNFRQPEAAFRGLFFNPPFSGEL